MSSTSALLSSPPTPDKCHIHCLCHCMTLHLHSICTPHVLQMPSPLLNQHHIPCPKSAIASASAQSTPPPTPDEGHHLHSIDSDSPINDIASVQLTSPHTPDECHNHNLHLCLIGCLRLHLIIRIHLINGTSHALRMSWPSPDVPSITQPLPHPFLYPHPLYVGLSSTPAYTLRRFVTHARLHLHVPYTLHPPLSSRLFSSSASPQAYDRALGESSINRSN
mmetsp:Transcript_23009/g.41056  ORF Transcript_23009/g.41056 Transcript_23009/m.41056 type:complete len:221 (+) Transcript_23009:199-861(+)